MDILALEVVAQFGLKLLSQRRAESFGNGSIYHFSVNFAFKEVQRVAICLIVNKCGNNT